ncbi:hypothetical protein FISHEDRAFT_38201 [Fistulina hepatica ATCC 64428]|nr:hypothetical protein FISHEDRAFT_38201 [Fistulina hepatica ATCC 64428]
MDPTWDIISQLRRQISDVEILTGLLCAPLDCLGLLPPQFAKYNVHPLPKRSVVILRHIPPLQQALLHYVVPTWEPILKERKLDLLVQQYFRPDAFSYTSVQAGSIALLAYSTILSESLNALAIQLLSQLVKEYPLDRLYAAVFSSEDAGSRQLLWEDTVKNVLAIPGKVANALMDKDKIPTALESSEYFTGVCLRCARLVNTISSRETPAPEDLASITYLLVRLVNIGVFPATHNIARSQTSFFGVVLPQLRARACRVWPQILAAMPSSFHLQAMIASLFAHLDCANIGLDASPVARARVKREARVLCEIVGDVSPVDNDVWESVVAVIQSREWTEAHARVFVCWISQCNPPLLRSWLDLVLEVWTSPEHIRHSLLSTHRYLTTHFLLTISHFPALGNEVKAVSLKPSFISSMTTYIGHMDNSVRRCGMLSAEIVAQMAGQKLDFGDWDDASPDASMWQPWCHDLRRLVRGKDSDADMSVELNGPQEDTEKVISSDAKRLISETKSEKTRAAHGLAFTQESAGYDSDDSLTGYAESPASSRSVSPSPSELAEIEKDPTLAVGEPTVKVGDVKITRPVYLAQLGSLLRGPVGLKPPEPKEEVMRVEMALNYAEELIRRKATYGTELEENAVNVAYGLIGLHDNFETSGFDQKRQAAVTALVACCPMKAAPSLIEEFFKNQYSTDQRYVILNALALGARELASLPVPASTVPASRIAFPSKALPPALHQKYLELGAQQNRGPNQKQMTDSVTPLLEGLSRQAMDRTQEEYSDRLPEVVRERRLRVQQPARVTELPDKPRGPSTTNEPLPSKTTFTAVAANYFIAPLINRFWLFLRDEQTREERTAELDRLHRYRGGGGGLILSPMVLAHMLGTLAVLMHASQAASEWLAVLAPDALELAVTLGVRRLSLSEMQGDVLESNVVANDADSEGKHKDASVLSAALELIVIVLDGCLLRDSGRSLALEHTTLLLGAGEWARTVFERLENGEKIRGGGGLQEAKLKRAAAGALLKVEELAARWRRAMVDFD